MSKKRATLTDLLNDLTFQTLYEKYKLLATSLFEWEGLPDGIDSKYIERYLFEHGKAIFFRDPEMSFMCLEAQESKYSNVYGEPLSWTASGFKYIKTYDADECVIIDNNELRLATHPFIMFYVNKLTEAERTMDVNVKSVKSPVIFACDDKDVLTWKRIFQEVDGNTPALFADKRLDLNSIAVYDTKAKFMGNELMDYKKSVENELFTFLGLNNAPIDKKERVNVPEVNSNNALIDSFASLQLSAREKACEKINEMFGLNVSVKRKESGVVDNVELDNVEHNEIDS